ncbi:MAG: ComEC/Rec2 family competence protein [Paracoccaceae bacterium]
MFSPTIPWTTQATGAGAGGGAFWVRDPFSAARGRLFPFVPVALGIGIGLYFALPGEPGSGVLAGLVVLAAAALAAGVWGPEGLRPLALALALVAAGLVIAAVRAATVAAPVIGYHRYGPVEGRVIEVDRSISDAVRITLDEVVLPGLPPLATPRTVRLSLHGDPPGFGLMPGLRVATTAHLSPPGGPVEPGGFDFRRIAWFEGLGAVGYTRVPLVRTAEGDSGWRAGIALLRHDIAQRIHARFPDASGGVVAALLTGDRFWVDAATTEALRRANLSHLLAISGLHMGLLVGAVLAGLRALLALSPTIALTLPLRQIAAVGALVAASVYLVMSGANVATQRAYVMAVVMLGAVLLGRRAVSVRSMAVAAVLILVWRPESLLSAGFQMSFAATLALVASFEGLARSGTLARGRGLHQRALVWAAGVVLCSVIAGLATGPISAAHFHRISSYGLIANVLSVPLMGALIMPAAILAALGAPFGLAGPGLWLMGLGTRWILTVADYVAAFQGAMLTVPDPPGWMLPTLALGGLWVLLWPAWPRFVGLVPVAVALWFWGASPRPTVLVAEGGALVGVMTDSGRVLSRARGAGFVARLWLENDGDAVAQPVAAARPGMTPRDGGVAFLVDGAPWVHLTGRAGLAALAGACQPGVTVVIDRPVAEAAHACRVLDAAILSDRGAMAILSDGSEYFADESSGQRLWVRQR